jgi:hypothetical protein
MMASSEVSNRAILLLVFMAMKVEVSSELYASLDIMWSGLTPAEHWGSFVRRPQHTRNVATHL